MVWKMFLSYPVFSRFHDMEKDNDRLFANFNMLSWQMPISIFVPSLNSVVDPIFMLYCCSWPRLM